MGNLTDKQWGLIIGGISVLGAFLIFLMQQPVPATLLFIVGFMNIVDALLFGLKNPVSEIERSVKQKAIGLSYVATIIAFAIFIALVYFNIIKMNLNTLIVLFFISLLFSPIFQIILRAVVHTPLGKRLF